MLFSGGFAVGERTICVFTPRPPMEWSIEFSSGFREDRRMQRTRRG